MAEVFMFDGKAPLMRKRFYLVVAVTVAVPFANAAYQWSRPRPHDPRVLPAEAVNWDETYSNILPADYVGPETCAECHPSHFSKWQKHPHRKMNQMASATSIQGDFNSARVQLTGGEAAFTNDGSGRHFMTVKKNGTTHRKYLVTRTVGSRYMQFYVGKQVYGPEADSDPIFGEHMLPFSYWFKMKRWYPRQYFDPDGDEIVADGIPQLEAIHRKPDVRPYSAVCMNCHNTFPYAYRIFNPLFVGFPDATVAATVEPLSHDLASTIKVDPSAEGFYNLNGKLDPEKHLVTLGISCESCHFGGREHALEKKAIRFLPTSKYVQLQERNPAKHLTADRKNPLIVKGVCVQCHSGNGKKYPNGAGKSNSREGLDFHAGFCTTEMSCVTCHDPHRPSAGPSGGPTLAKHVAVCTKCHNQYADETKALVHSKHPQSAGVNCLDCHMPRYTQGLDELIRTHRITHPVEEKMVAAGSANACNLCHLDKSLRWTLNELDKGWGKKLHVNPEWPSYADLEKPIGPLWLKGKDNQLRLVASQSYARSPLGKKMLPELVHALNDPEPLNRVFHSCAVQKICGVAPHEALAVDITAPPAVRAKQIEALLRKHK